MGEINEILDTIERYTKGQMSKAEQAVFEEQLTWDAFLCEQLELSAIVDHMVVGAEAWKLKEQMQKDLYKSKTSIWPYLSFLLLVIGAVTGLYIHYQNNLQPTPVLLPATSTVPTNLAVQEEDKSETTSSVVKKTTIPPNEKQTPKTQPNVPKVTTAFEKPKEEAYVDPVVMVPVANQPQPMKAADKPFTVSKINPCAGLVGDVAFDIIPSCKGQETGEIQVKAETVKGGQAPYIFYVGERSASRSINHLAPGQYTLLIKDANGCTVENTLPVIIGQKNCSQKNEYVFNPEYDGTWSIPYDKEKLATEFKIADKNGKTFFQSPVVAAYPTEWKGESSTGLTLGTGLYFFTIDYADGTVDEGSIVVSR